MARPLAHPQPDGAGARVGLDLGVAGEDGLAGEGRPRRERVAVEVARRRVAARRARAQQPLDAPVLEGVVRHDCEPTARPHQAGCSREDRLELVHLGVDLDAQRLEDARCPLGQLLRRARLRRLHHARELRRAPQRACRDESARERAREALLSVPPEDVRNLGGAPLVEDGGGGELAARLVHPHVERPLEPHREATRRLINLVRAHAEIEQHAREPSALPGRTAGADADAGARQRRREAAKARLQQRRRAARST
mmetsp:Transcript_3196/g.10511  ORF Transcript_3196/g.10511 Transcript_3196/m.10511 type:complete len:254 (-) Transcript_3196:220-981(-)